MTNTDAIETLLDAGRAALLEAAFLTGDFQKAAHILEAAHQQAEADDDPHTRAAVLDQLGFLQHWQNVESEQSRDVDAELALFEQALALRQELRDDAGIAESLFHIGLVHQLFRGDWEIAQGYLERADALADRSGDSLLCSEIHRHIGAYHWLHKGDFPTAIHHLCLSLELRETLGFRGWLASGLITLGQCELAAGQTEQGMAHLREGVQLAEAIGLRPLWTRRAKEILLAAT